MALTSAQIVNGITLPRITSRASLENEAERSATRCYFFTPNTMRFFNSRILEGTIFNLLNGDVLFVTSERFDETTPRMYSVRIMHRTIESRDSDGMNELHVSVDTIGDRHATAYLAKRALRNYVYETQGITGLA